MSEQQPQQQTQQPINKKRIPFCPLLSAGAHDLKICTQEHCAWYINSSKTCVMYVIGHNNILDIKAKQAK